MSDPYGLAFNGAGDLFAADGSGITKIAASGTRSIFASGLNAPLGLAFNSAGDLFESDANTGNIYEFAPDGTQTVFASGLESPDGLAFQGVTLPVPEPSAFVLLAVGVTALLIRGQRKIPKRK